MKLMQDGCSAKNLQSISDMPAADVAEVVHGRWIKDDFLSDDVNNAEKCSQCGELIGWFGNLPNYCPNCRAKMDGGNDDAVD
nr:MAG TPA: zinc-ribbon containing domain protein [Caudoviricetes sp.]